MSKYICEHFLICPRKKTCHHASMHSIVNMLDYEVCTENHCPLLGLDSICLKVKDEEEL